MYPGVTQGFTLGYGLKVSPSGLRVERLDSGGLNALRALRVERLNSGGVNTLRASALNAWMLAGGGCRLGVSRGYSSQSDQLSLSQPLLSE